MYALKYGTVPVVRSTGGLDDTIVQFDSKKGAGNGFKFGPYKPVSFLAAIRKAVDLFQNAEAWEKLVANGMKADFSWDRSAQRYLELYDTVIEKGPQQGKTRGA
jgi:starch synthase